MFKIGNVEIKNNVVLAPMAGITNSAFRSICKEMGVGLVVAEMVSDKAIMYNSKKTIDMLYMDENERPISQQIFGSDKDSFVIAAKYIYENMKPDIIDINMGCPVPKVAEKAQAGSALLKDPAKVEEIVTAVVKSVPIPVTVKIRSGWDEDNINAVEIAKIIEKSGAKAITIHPRTRKQGYAGLSNWSIIKQVKESVNIPVIGNGDIKSCYDAKRMLDETGCDAVMIGRATLGNPWIIKETIEYLEKGKEPIKPDLEEKIRIIRKHIDNLMKTKNEKLTLLEIRSHIGWYLKGEKNSKEIKQQVCLATNIKELYEIIDKMEESNAS
ncbi:MAG: tRNA dihydrouridine synthase DusB [Bacilli bacterium]|nr:tRNA dihydrouridine synthase DusB [Bacilli bacterium]